MYVKFCIRLISTTRLLYFKRQIDAMETFHAIVVYELCILFIVLFFIGAPDPCFFLSCRLFVWFLDSGSVALASGAHPRMLQANGERSHTRRCRSP